MHVAIYVAIAENGVIGRDNGLPWRLSTDMKRFKATTMGKPVIMGRKTWESFPRRPLPGAPTSWSRRDRAYRAEGAETRHVARGCADACQGAGRAAWPGVDEICVIGGGEIYRQAMPIADRLYVTHVLAELDGDTRFPDDRPGGLAERERRGASGRRKGHACDALCRL